MNYLNGGYTMIKYNATQTELQNAYVSKKPVVVYDADGRGDYAYIVIDNTTYKIKKLEKKYKHFCYFSYISANACIEIINNSSADLTGADITAFIQSLPANAIYPVKNVEFAKLTGPDRVIMICGLKNYTNGGAKFGYVTINLLSPANSSIDGSYSNLTITSQYAIEI